MELAQAIGHLAAKSQRVDLGRAVYVARGYARSTALSLHQTLARAAFPGEALSPTAEELADIRRRLVALYEADYDAAQAGYYPASLLDFSWTRLARTYPRLLADMPRVRRRVLQNRYDEVPAEAQAYPAYYRRTFHFQSDGYLSAPSARRYDAQVELLFSGTADVMRRQVLPPIVAALRGTDPANLHVLDVACGTGSFLRMLAAALPRASLYGLDLSPYYIAHARRELAQLTPLSLVVENAEAMPFVDGYFQAVTNVYLMHELPPAVRSRVLGEIARVLAPGGTFVLADSLQLSDAPVIRRQLLSFPERFHEPFYRHYLTDDLGARIREAGLEIREVRQAFLTKLWVCGKRA